MSTGLGKGARAKRYYKKRARPRFQRNPAQRVNPAPIIYRMPQNQSLDNIKVCDHTFEAAYQNPYVPDILAKTHLNCSTTGAMQALMVQQGAGETQRIGNRIRLKSLRIRMWPDLGPANNYGFDSIIRLCVIYDRQPNAAYPAAALLLANKNEAGTNSGFDYLGDIPPDYKERFVMLSDTLIMLPPYSAAAGGVGVNSTQYGSVEQPFVINKYIRLKGLESVYSAQSSPMLIGNQTTGALYVFGCGSVAAGAEPYALVGKCRLTFQDY